LLRRNNQEAHIQSNRKFCARPKKLILTTSLPTLRAVIATLEAWRLSLFRVVSRHWSIESESLFSTKETLKYVVWGAENGTQRTLGELLWASANDPIETLTGSDQLMY
jgi:hypothetical protein